MQSSSWLNSQKSYNLKNEVIAGVTNFMAIAYIVVVNPLIMNVGGSGFPINAIITATVITIIVMTFFVGFFVKLPFAMAPGMGFNAILAYSLVIEHKLPISIALGVVFWSSLLFLLLAMSRLQKYLIRALPTFLPRALGAGLGAFLIFIGLKNAHIIVANPDTLVSLGGISLQFFVTLIGIIVTGVLFIRGKQYAFLAPILVIALITLLLNHATLPKHVMIMPEFSLFLHIDFIHSLQFSLLPVILSLFLVSYFDATTTTLGLISQFNFNDSQLVNKVLNRGLISDALGSIFSSIMGTANGIIYIESSAAIQQGAKTGIPAIVTAILFIPFLFLAPLIGLIPLYATTPTLVLVGLLMIHHGLKHFKMDNLEDVVSEFLTILVMPFTFSVTAGAVFGIISYVLLKLFLGKYKELSPLLIIIALICCSWFLVQ